MLFTIDTIKINKQSFLQQFETIGKIDTLLQNYYKIKYNNSQNIITYLKTNKMPKLLRYDNITLFSLFQYFNKVFVYKKFTLYNFSNPIFIVSKPNNFSHLFGIRATRDDEGNIISRIKVKDFLDGVIYQFISLKSCNQYNLDKEKLEVFNWIPSTLNNPTYIFDKFGINSANTKIKADFVFVKQVFNSNKYAYHLVALKNEYDRNYAIISQFGITKERLYRMKKMFFIDKAIYNFFKENKKPR